MFINVLELCFHQFAQHVCIEYCSSFDIQENGLV